MTFLEFNTESEEYKQALQLRQSILRAPLGLDIFQEDLSVEEKQLHFGLKIDNIIVACVTVIPVSKSLAKLRQMAVKKSFQGQGLGTQLFRECLKDLKNKGFKEVVLNARESAVGFYQKFGFSKVGEEFIEVTIPHYKMMKTL